MNWYIKVLKQYVDFRGRARRQEYWMFVLFNAIIAFVLGLIDGLLGWEIPYANMGILGLIYSLGVFLPSLAVCVRRLHDIGKSGWYILLSLIPLVGAIILIVWFCKEGEGTSNDWGENPKAGEADF